jgi:nicotinamide riboside kinase
MTTLKIGIMGIPGTGKTTLARSVASRCRNIPSLKNIETVQEYARHYILKHGAITSIYEQYRILEKQTEWEDNVCNTDLNLMITDSPVFMGFLYCCDLPKTNSKEILFFNDIFKKMTKLNYPVPRYDIIFHLTPELKPSEDGVRPSLHFDDKWREKADILVRSVSEIFRPGHFYLVEQTDLDKRADFCIDTIRSVMNHEESK